MVIIKEDLLLRLRSGAPLSLRQQLRLTAQLSLPAILAQLSTILMQYIDASMVGQLGANDSASIGLVASSLNLTHGICGAAAVGFTIQVAQSIGARQERTARDLMKQGFAITLAISLVVLAVGVAISGHLPHWLGADPAICANASTYFLIACVTAPIVQLYSLSAGMLQATGDLRTPGIVMGGMCLLDVFFNALLIFPTRSWHGLTLPGAGLGVAGAALGTMLAEVVAAGCLLWRLLRRSPMLHLRRGEGFRFHPAHLRRCIRLALPVAVERVLMTSAQVVITGVVAPLGTVPIAADSFAATAESIGYMPAYGIQNAASTLVGQSVGARRKKLAYRFGVVTILFAMAVMVVTGSIMYLGAPAILRSLSPDGDVVALGTKVLRIALLSEPFYAVTVVVLGVCQGAGDTLRPTFLNFISMWGVRITLILLLVGQYGLAGVWFARAVEVTVRGSLFLLYILRRRWLPKELPDEEPIPGGDAAV